MYTDTQFHQILMYFRLPRWSLCSHLIRVLVFVSHFLQLKHENLLAWSVSVYVRLCELKSLDARLWSQLPLPAGTLYTSELNRLLFLCAECFQCEQPFTEQEARSAVVSETQESYRSLASHVAFIRFLDLFQATLTKFFPGPGQKVPACATLNLILFNTSSREENPLHGGADKKYWTDLSPPNVSSKAWARCFLELVQHWPMCCLW